MSRTVGAAWRRRRPMNRASPRFMAALSLEPRIRERSVSPVGSNRVIVDSLVVDGREGHLDQVQGREVFLDDSLRLRKERGSFARMGLDEGVFPDLVERRI